MLHELMRCLQLLVIIRAHTITIQYLNGKYHGFKKQETVCPDNG